MTDILGTQPFSSTYCRIFKTLLDAGVLDRYGISVQWNEIDQAAGIGILGANTICIWHRDGHRLDMEVEPVSEADMARFLAKDREPA